MINVINQYHSGDSLLAIFRGLILFFILITLFISFGIDIGYVWFFSLIFYITQYLCIIFFAKLGAKDNTFFYIVYFITIVYYDIPLIGIVALGDDFVWGSEFGGALQNYLQYNQLEYFSSFIFTWLSLLIGCVASSYFIIRNKKFIRQGSFFNEHKPSLILIYFINILFACYLYFFSSNILNESSGYFLLIKMILQDKAIIIINGFYIYVLIKNNRNYKIHSLFLFMFSLFFLSINLSKGAMLFAFLFFFFLPLIYYSSQYEAKYLLILPKLKYLLIMLFLSIFLFLIIFNVRNDSNNVLWFDHDMNFLLTLKNIIFKIVARLYDQGINHSILLIGFMINEGNDCFKGIDLFLYQIKNFINLLLPGTIFPESYAPSSMQFYNIIGQCSVIENMHNKTNLYTNLNTQPFTIYGYFWLMFGYVAPIFIFIYSFVLNSIYTATNGVTQKLFILIFFFGFMSNFGLDDELFAALHLTISVFIIKYVINVLSRIR